MAEGPPRWHGQQWPVQRRGPLRDTALRSRSESPFHLQGTKDTPPLGHVTESDGPEEVARAKYHRTQRRAREPGFTLRATGSI